MSVVVVVCISPSVWSSIGALCKFSKQYNLPPCGQEALFFFYRELRCVDEQRGATPKVQKGCGINVCI